jgi:DNA-binding SARP family transcriptional activator
LQGHNDEWIVARRADFRSGYLEALVALAGRHEQSGDDEAALALYQRAVSEAGEREDIHREVIRMYGKLGRRSEAADQYNKLVQDMKQRHGVKPSPETEKVYHEAVGE